MKKLIVTPYQIKVMNYLLEKEIEILESWDVAYEKHPEHDKSHEYIKTRLVACKTLWSQVQKKL